MRIHPYRAVVMGGSSGSMEALKMIIPSLRGDLTVAVFIVCHIHADSGDFMVRHLDAHAKVRVKQPEDKERIESGVVYMAPANYHLLVEGNGTLALSTDQAVNYSRPSIDVLFESAADVYTRRLIGIILSGANTDGSRGLTCVKDKGGLAVVQSPDSSVMGTMPRGAMKAASADYVLDAQEIAILVNRMTG